MKAFDLHVDVAVPPELVMDAYWRLQDWPSVAPHVERIEMHFEDDNVQVLTMHVVTKGRLDRFKSVRVRKHDTIYYFQPTPPPILNHHHGNWRIAEMPHGTRVTSSHTIGVNPEPAVAFLAAAGVAATAEDCTEYIAKIIENNSLQTMTALRDRLERAKGGDVRCAAE